MMFPKVPEPIEKKEPIRVKFIPPKKSEISTFVETSKPKKIEAPTTSEIVSKYDSKAHSPAKTQNNPELKNQKTTIPRIVPRKPTPTPVPLQQPIKALKKPKKVVKKEKSQPIKETKVQAKKSLEKKIKNKTATEPPEPKPEIEKMAKLEELSLETSEQPRMAIKSPQLPPFQSLLSMIDGIDPDKYATIDTTDEEDSADEVEVSLNTKEIKYADYMARIKHQIEKVWLYPEQAASRGISGEITLRFRLSEEGNLLSVRMLDSSGTKILDVAAIKAVKGAAPYYPFPSTITKKRLSITASFIYNPFYGNPYANR